MMTVNDCLEYLDTMLETEEFEINEEKQTLWEEFDDDL